MTPIDKFKVIINKIILSNGHKPIAGLNITDQFQPGKIDDFSVARSINSAFLIMLSGKSHPDYNNAADYIDSLYKSDKWRHVVSFFIKGKELIFSEIEKIYKSDNELKESLDDLYLWLNNSSKLSDKNGTGVRTGTINKLRRFFFPEGIYKTNYKAEGIPNLREKRKVTITNLNKNPVTAPDREILFTSNVLLTIPSSSRSIDSLDLNSTVKTGLKDILNEEQLYWYDHPIQIGTVPERNEAIYGLVKLDEALKYEEENGNKDKTSKLDCVLSVSVTHNGLHEISKEYLETELKKHSNIERMNLYAFNEENTKTLISDIFIPAAKRYIADADPEILYTIFGVDGEYGRHYSFLKAISAFWHVFISPEIRGTFKIDLDQMFPQELLMKETGSSFFDHLTTPLWGAEGEDAWNNKVHLGMIAGALVNENDIIKSIYTPDVKFSSKELYGDELIFYSVLPQAVSTEAEMMTRYNGQSDIDGKSICIQRIHVTGGTSGILVDSLRRYRLFTPSFIGRAEDQSFIMSVLFDYPNTGYLRCVHEDGLIMRHDKETFAGEAIKSARIGKMIGDYIRILLFSYYADALPWPADKIKEAIDPFTGCFVSKIPFSIVYLRFALKAAVIFDTDDENENGCIFLSMGAKRLGDVIETLSSGENPLVRRYRSEKKGWNLYYDILEKVEEKISEGDAFAEEILSRAKTIVKNCKLKI